MNHKVQKKACALVLALLLLMQGTVPVSLLNSTVQNTPVTSMLSYALAEDAPDDNTGDEPEGIVPEGATNDLDGSKIEGIQVLWVTQDSQTNNDGQAVAQAELDDKSHLYLATTSSAALSMIYKVEVEFSGQYDYAPGDITITIPAQVWHGRQYEETGVEGETVGVVNPGKLVGTLELPLPAAPSKKADFNWQIIDGNYVLTNTRTIGATSSVSIEVAIRGIRPIDVVDMSECDPITAHCEVVTNQGNTIELTSLPINAQIDTKAYITSAYKNGEVFEEYPDLPNELLQNLPEGKPEDYLYVRWYTYHSHTNNQPFSLDITDVLSDAYEYTDGPGSEKKYVTDGIFLGSTNYKGEIIKDGTIDFSAEIVDHDTTSTTGTQYSHTVYMWSAYKKSDFYVPYAYEPQRVYYFENEVEWTLTETDKAVSADQWNKPEDPQLVTSKKDEAAVLYSPIRYGRPFGSFAVNKWTESVGYKDWLYGYALNQLESNNPVDMDYVVETIGYGYPWTSPRTAGFSYDDLSKNKQNVELDQLGLSEDDYGLLGWKQITDDFQTFFNFESTPLTSEDFQFKGLRISEPTRQRWAKQSNGVWAYQTDSSLPIPDLVIEYQLNNEDAWYPAATATWGEDGKGEFRFVDVSGACSVSGKTVYFPENTTDTRHTFVSNVFGGKTAEKCDIAMLDWYVYPIITMKPSDRVRQIVRELFEQNENPTTKFKNDVVMDVYGWVEKGGEGTLVLDDDFDASRATFAGASYGVSLNKTSSFESDVENQRLLIRYKATLTEQSNLKNRSEYDVAVRENVIPAETSGVWYDLLPPHVVPLLDTVELRSGDTISNIYTIDNYKDTGRILLVVEAELTPKPSYKNNLGYADQPTLEFTAAYTWLDMDEYGRNLVNYVAFESTVDNLNNGTLGSIKNQKGEPDNPLAGNNATTPKLPADIAEALTGLNPDTVPGENRFVYGKCDHSVSSLVYAVSGLEKSVSDDLVGIWTQGLDGQEQVTVYEGLGYSYRLRVSSAENTSTKGIIIYDTIENYIIPDPSADEDTDATKAADFEHTEERKGWSGDWQGKGQWRGTLKAVDLSEFVNAGVAPVLLYSQLPGLQFADSQSGSTDDNFGEDTELFASGNYDITDRSIWQVAQLNEKGIWQVPEGVNVTAVAIDATTNADGTDFILKPEETLAGYLRMQAPDDNGDPDAWHAKGAYARTENGEVDWEAAMDATNNMYAYNNARVRLIQGNTKDNNTTWLSSYRMIRNDYTRVGILPGVIQLEKEWKDQDNHDGMRPEAVTVTVERRVAGQGGQPQPVIGADGQPLTATMDESTDWTTRFEQIDLVNEQGLRYLYSFKEQPVEGYESKVEFIDMNHYRLINVHPNEQITPSGEKIWTDDDNAYGVRPDTVTLTLYQDGVVVATQEVRADAEGKWTYTFGNLDKYADGGTPYKYHVEEEYVPKYEAEIEGYQLVNNTYNPKGELTVTKTVVNATPKALEKAFTFTLVLLAEQTDPAAAPMPLMDKYPYEVQQLVDGQWQPVEGQTGTIGNGDTFTLKHNQKLLVKELPSESTYQVVETEAAGFTTTFTDAEGSIRAGQTAQADFTNTYAASGSVQLSVDKSLNGRQIRKNQFRFELVDNNPDSSTYGEVIRTARMNAPDATTGGCGVEEIVSDAKAIFGQLGYTEADAGKTFHYIMREVNVGAAGFGYDTTEHQVTVTVADDNGDGSLTVTHNFEDAPAAFENTYTATGELVLKAWKTLEGRELKAGEFTFELYQFDNEKGDITGDCLGIATNDAEGNIVFDALKFDQNDVSLNDDEPATYTYLVREKQGSDKTVVYSNQEYVYTVKVFDNGDGTLSFAQGSQGYTREYVTCPVCAGNGYDYFKLEQHQWYSKPEDRYFGYTVGSDIFTYKATKEKPFKQAFSFCTICHGTTVFEGSKCEHCFGCGVEAGVAFTYPDSSTSSTRIGEYVELLNSSGKPTGEYAVYIGIGGNNNSFIYYSVMADTLKICDHCDGEKVVPGSLTITGDITMPVFENTLKPGSLSVTKLVEGANPNTAQTFRFHVRFTGEQVPDEVKMELKQLDNRTPSTFSLDPWWKGEPDPVKEVYHANPEELVGDAYAVYNSAEKEVVFFRAEKDEDGYAIDPYGNRFKVPVYTGGYNFTDQNGLRYTYNFEDLEDPRYEYDLYWRISTVETVRMRDPIKPKSLKYWFTGMAKVKNLDMSKLDTSDVKDFSHSFYYSFVEYSKSVDVTFLDTSNATNFTNMFFVPNISNLAIESLNVGNLDFTNVDIENTEGFYGSNLNRGGVVKRLTINDTFKVKYSPDDYRPYKYGDNTLSGKWRNVETGEILESQELFEGGGHAGTWIWDRKECILTFKANGGAGQMSDVTVLASKDFTFYPTLYRYGYRLSGFNANLASYGDKFIPVNADGSVTIKANYLRNYNSSGPTKSTLTAVWKPIPTSLEVTKNGFTFTLLAGETATFNDLPAGTAYEVWEETPAGWKLVKKVNDSGIIQPTETTKAEFTNSYTPTKAVAALRASKTLDGLAAAAGAYTFTLTGEGVNETIANATGGSVQFTPIEYDVDDIGKTFTYTIAEIPGSDATIAYDANTYTATVTVSDNGKGVLTAAVAYNTTDGKPPVFQNTTKPGNLIIRKTTEGATGAADDRQFTIEVRFTDAMGQPWSGSVMLFDQPTYITDGLYTGKLGNGGALSFTGIPAGVHYTVSEPELLPGWVMDTEKSGVIESTVTSEEELTNTYTVKGVAAPIIHKALVGRTLKEDEFTFQLVDKSNYVVGTATNAADGTVIFPDISYEAEGTYQYVAMEVPGEDTTVAYSGQKVHITIVMEDVEGEGRLTPTITYATEELDGTVAQGENTITNKVKPGTLKVSKSVVSDYALHAQQAFTFTLLLTDAMGQPLNGQYVIEKSGETQHLNVTGGNASFTLKDGETAIITGLPHGSNYAVTETKAGGFTAAGTGANGTIAATQTAEAAFTNTYSAKGDYTPVASKSLSGKELAQGDFVFVLQDEEGYELASAFNEADGSVTFPKLSFTDADVGQKVYQLVEKDNGLAGMSYDTVVRTITLTIADNGDGTLSVTDDLNGQPVIFTNTYDDMTSHAVQKVWQDEEDAAGLRPESITVKLYQNKVEFAQATLTAENGWAYTFTDLPAFDEQGINYTYEVHEVPVPGYTSGVNTQGNVTTITNTLLGVLEVSKTVETGDQQQAFGFTAALTLDGQPLTGSYSAVLAGEATTVETDDNGKVSFLLKHGETLRIYGLPIGANFTVGENESTVYDSAVTEGNPEGIIQRCEISRVGFTNSVKTVSFTVTKQWEGGSGPIELTLYANGEKLNPQPVCIRNGDVYTYENLPKYDELNNVIVYSAKEKYFDRYVTIYVNEAPYEGVSDRVHDGGTIINRAKKYASFRILKEWRGLEEGENPPAITLTLYCNGEVMNVATPKPKNGWYEYFDLPETYNGAPAVYTVVEEPLPGFTVAYKDANGDGVGNGVNGGTIVNSKIPDTGDRTPIGLAAGLVVASAIGLVLLLVWRRKKK